MVKYLRDFQGLEIDSRGASTVRAGIQLGNSRQRYDLDFWHGATPLTLCEKIEEGNDASRN